MANLLQICVLLWCLEFVGLFYCCLLPCKSNLKIGLFFIKTWLILIDMFSFIFYHALWFPILSLDIWLVSRSLLIYENFLKILMRELWTDIDMWILILRIWSQCRTIQWLIALGMCKKMAYHHSIEGQGLWVDDHKFQVLFFIALLMSFFIGIHSI